jgi:hypothetical protein
VVADRGGGGGGGGDLAESAMVSGSRMAVAAERHEVVAELAALHVGHVAQWWSPRAPSCGTSAASPRSTTRSGERLGVQWPAPSSCRRSRRRRR